MGDGRAWTRDINELESLARTEMNSVKDDMSHSADLVATINVDPVSFGKLKTSHGVAQAHEQVRARYEQAVRVRSERVRVVARTIATIAEHYRMPDEHYG